MFRVIFEPDRGQRVPIRIWARAISPETVRQLQRLASRPYVVDFVAAMADAHVAEGVAVGTVFATERTVVPRALGGDLGCGATSSSANAGSAVTHVHRKCAVAVRAGTLALIPGSMGTASYIVEGIGSDDAFGSCSHGAGRVMSRKEARAAIRPDAFERAMRRVVYPDGRSRHLVEEAPAAYRDIGDVLEDQEDLVRRRLRLEPIAVLKGFDASGSVRPAGG